MKALAVLTASSLAQLPHSAVAERVGSEPLSNSRRSTAKCPYHKTDIAPQDYFKFYEKKWRNKVGIAAYYLGPGAYHTAVLFQNHLFTFGLPSDDDCQEKPPASGVQIEEFFPTWPKNENEAKLPQNGHYEFYKQVPKLYMVDLEIRTSLMQVKVTAGTMLPSGRSLPCFNNCLDNDKCKYHITKNNCNSFSLALLKLVTVSRCTTLPRGTTRFTGALDLLPHSIGHTLVGSAYSKLLARADRAEKECDDFRATGKGCSWTQTSRCPTQPKGRSRRSAKSDGSVGFRCCCSACEAYMKEANACGWTKEYSCPGQPMGQEVAGDTHSLGFVCCCLQERWKLIGQ
mmetsp:Transcript_36229/g.104294  ORF Transcript_36229/g.104294 Transcript_36229/m.104294 type:complete len:343 (+) Transcript_36229:76-1104(+)